MFQKGVLKLEIKKEELAIVFVPCQSWGELYDKDQALKAGTIFKELDKPFYAAEQIPAVQEPLAEEASKSPQRILIRRDWQFLKKLMKKESS